MDPKANLARQRELAAAIIEATDRLDPPEAVERHAGPLLSNLANNARELAEHVEALDEWHRKFGFDPYDDAEKVHIVIWRDEGGVNAQAYHTKEAAERDADSFDGIDPAIVESTVQS